MFASLWRVCGVPSAVEHLPSIRGFHFRSICPVSDSGSIQALLRAGCRAQCVGGFKPASEYLPDSLAPGHYGYTTCRPLMMAQYATVAITAEVDSLCFGEQFLPLSRSPPPRTRISVSLQRNDRCNGLNKLNLWGPSHHPISFLCIRDISLQVSLNGGTSFIGKKIIITNTNCWSPRVSSQR